MFKIGVSWEVPMTVRRIMTVRRMMLSSLAALTLAAPSQAVGAPPDSAGKTTADRCPCEMANGAGGMQPGMGGGPMSGMCGRMGQMADVTVENTPNGAAVHLNAKDSSQLEAVRQMAQRTGRCMCGPTMAPPARPPYRPDQR
jgi:hypothetical protein